MDPNTGYPQLATFLMQIVVFIDAILVPVIFALAFIVFLWGVFQYFIAGAADEEKRKQGRQFVLYGLIGFVLMISIWGIVNVLVNSLGFDSNSRPALPVFGGASGGGEYTWDTSSNSSDGWGFGDFGGSLNDLFGF